MTVIAGAAFFHISRPHFLGAKETKDIQSVVDGNPHDLTLGKLDKGASILRLAVPVSAPMNPHHDWVAVCSDVMRFSFPWEVNVEVQAVLIGISRNRCVVSLNAYWF